MTSIADAAFRRLTYKAYTTATIDPTTNPDPSTDSDLGTSGGQIIPYVAGLVASVQRPELVSNEKRADMQQYDIRAGVRRVPITIPFELSPKTYQDFMAAVLRNTWTSGPSKTEVDFTSLAATASSSKFTVGSSDWATQGFKVGMVINAGSTISGANANKNFTITALNGVDATVYPAPEDMVADTSFTIAATGRYLVAPEAGSFVLSKFALEDYHVDTDIAQVASQMRFGGMTLNMPVEGMVTGQFTGQARDVWSYTDASAPLFTNPTAEVGTAHLTQVGGHLLVGGAQVANVTSADLSVMTGADPAITGFNPNPVAAEITTGILQVTGTLNVFFYDTTLLDDFLNETELALDLHLPASNADAADFIKIFMPRIKITSFDKGDAQNGPIPVTCKFRALRKNVSTGFPSGPILIQDSLSA